MPDVPKPLPLDYAAPRRRYGKKPGRRAWLMIILVMAAGSIFLVLAQPEQRSYRIKGNRPSCASRMQQIGLAIFLYQGEHAGVYPNALEDLMEERISAYAFICPSSNDTASTAATTQQLGADFRASGHLSYIYVGKGLTDKTVTPDMVVLYEPLNNHRDGINVLFGDGHVEFFVDTIATKIIAAAATGNRVRVNEATGLTSIVPVLLRGATGDGAISVPGR